MIKVNEIAEINRPDKFNEDNVTKLVIYSDNKLKDSEKLALKAAGYVLSAYIPTDSGLTSTYIFLKERKWENN